MARRIWTLIVKELLGVWRDGRTRAVIIGPPLLQLLIFSFAATYDIANLRLGILDESRTPASRELVAGFAHASVVRETVALSRPQDIGRMLDEKRVTAVVHLGADFDRRLRAAQPAPVQIVLDGRASNTALIVQGYLSTIIARFNEARARDHGPEPTPPSATLAPRAWFNPNLHSRWMVVPSLIGILTMIVTLVLTSLSVARERELGTMEQLLVTPLKPWEIVLGKTVPALLIGFAEGLVIAAAAVWLFGIPFHGSILLLALALGVYMLSVIGVGLFVSALAQTQQQAILGAFLFLVPAILLSGFATPIANMPAWLQMVTLADPLRHFLVIVLGLFLKGLSAELVLASLWPMTLIAAATLAGSTWFFRRRLY